jgi:hypothetical protein
MTGTNAMPYPVHRRSVCGGTLGMTRLDGQSGLSVLTSAPVTEEGLVVGI